MTILFNTAKSRYPDITGADSGEFSSKVRATITNALTALGARVFSNSFLEDGTTKVPGTSFAGSQISDVVAPMKRRIYTQDIQPSLIIKKRMFSTLKDSFDIKYSDEKERLYLRAIKTLFRKKCEDIAFYESIIFIDKIIEDPDFIYGASAIGNIVSAISGIASFTNSIAGAMDGVAPAAAQEATASFFKNNPEIKQLFNIKSASERAKQSKFTTWIVDPYADDLATTGPGNGIIEFTMMTSISTACAITPGGGSCTINMLDPYKLSVITEADIDRAVKEAYLEDGRIPSYITTRSAQIMDEAIRLDAELNQSRRTRRVSEVSFNFPFGTSTEVRAYFESLNLEFGQEDLAVTWPQQVISSVLSGTDPNNPQTNIPDDQIFTLTEQVRVRQIFDILREYKVIQDRAIDEFQMLNNSNNDVRDKLRQEFIGQNIIQHMDAIHVFANSFTKDETPIYDASIAQLTQDITSSIMSIDDVTAQISEDIIEQERLTLAPDISLFLYKMIRNPHVFRGTGPQIWQGVVSGVRTSYDASTAAYKVTIEGADNTHFLEMSRINTKPGLTQVQGSLEDPLTPYDIQTEPSTGLIEKLNLLPENLKKIEAGIIKIHDYPNLGKTASADDMTVDTCSSNINPILTYRHMDGLTYRWKRGILTATQNVNMNTALEDNAALPGDITHDYGQTVVQDIFAKMDSADILSILVCNRPYNYNTFVRAALDAGSLVLPGERSGGAYFNYLFDIFEKSNPTNGKFIPAKGSVVDGQKVIDAAKYERQVVNNLGALSSLQRNKAQIIDKILDLKAYDSSEAVKVQLNGLNDDLNRVDISMEKLKVVSSPVSEISIFGDNVMQHIDQTDSDAISKRMAYTLLKKPEDVKYNKDKDFFIVSDRYDTDLSIQAFVQDLKSQNEFSPFENTYSYPIEIAKRVADTLHFELFADSQGNIVFRPPEYNKIPLSLMIKMIQLGQTDGVSLIPPFIENLIKDRMSLYHDKLMILELEMRERIALLGGINKLNQLESIGSSLGGTVYFVTNKEIQSDNLYIYSLDYLKIKQANDVKTSFAEEVQIEFALSGSSLEEEPDSVPGLLSEIASVRNELHRRTGRPGALFTGAAEEVAALVSEMSKYTGLKTGAASERLRLTNELSVIVSKRQIVINATQKLAEQSDAISQSSSVGAAGMLLGAFFSSMTRDASHIFSDQESVRLPSFLKDMITNDLQNTTGRNSGKRFIIEDDTIISADFSVNAPEFTRIDTYGSENLLGQGQTIVNGNPLAFWAGASDFDMWRQFGYRVTQAESIPYLTNPETQLAPYAVMRLLQQRGRIHQGSVRLIGNEHYQAGETVYVASKEMLFYIEKVSHEIDLTSNVFTTTLSLSYGRPLGQYIPQPFDIIGRTLLSDAKRGGLDMRTTRSRPSSSQIKVLETIHFPSEISHGGGISLDDDFVKEFIAKNKDSIKGCVIKAKGEIDSSHGSAVIEIRGYTMSTLLSTTGSDSAGLPIATPPKDTAMKYIKIIRDCMVTGIYPEKSVQIDETLAMDVANNISGAGVTPDCLSNSNFKQGSTPGVIVTIDKELTNDDIKYRRMPSQQAWANGSKTTDGKALGLPINSIDIVLIIDKNKSGDIPAESIQGTHRLPAQILPGEAPAPDTDIG